MQIGVFFGVLGACLLSNGLSVVFFYALFWGDAQKRRGVPEERFPLWWFLAASIPPLTCSGSLYLALRVIEP